VKVDEQLVFMVHRITVRCNECVRQVHVYVGTGVGCGLDEALTNVGWRLIGDEHSCPEHS
jgi:hypothetical protein